MALHKLGFEKYLQSYFWYKAEKISFIHLYKPGFIMYQYDRQEMIDNITFSESPISDFKQMWSTV